MNDDSGQVRKGVVYGDPLPEYGDPLPEYGDPIPLSVWLKMRQEQELEQRQEFPSCWASCFKKTKAEARRLLVDDYLDERAEAEGYRSGTDWLLCPIFPKTKAECKAYYRDEGEKFIVLYQEWEVEKVDRVLVSCVRAIAEKYRGKDWLDCQDGFRRWNAMNRRNLWTA
jgi:hypothetical protein